MKALRDDPVGMFALGALGVLVLIAVFAPWLAPYGMTEGAVTDRLLPPLSEGHLLGTNALGQDVLSRIIYGTRISMLVGLASVALAALVGTVVGLCSGYYRGWLDRIVSRIIDAQLSFPFMVLALTLAAILGPSLRNVIATLVISSWVIYARLVRGEVFAERQKEYVQAAEAVGTSNLSIMLRHILPNVAPTVVVMASLEVGRLILAEAAISFLGYGIQPPLASWGNMVAQGKTYLFSVWWLPTLPGIAIMITMLAANLAGDSLRDIFDVKVQQR